jgi:hypothetical protein
MSVAMSEKPSISEEQLRVCLQEQYDLIPVTLDFLPLGLDTEASVYRVVSEHGTPYFVCTYETKSQSSLLTSSFFRGSIVG